ncbi:MAG: hypothetical protein NTU88_01745, partial [Armatimonadetes bacterium]|nr:hypothetical protein [Armatimonadota bacterium]
FGVSCEDGIYFYGREPFVRADSLDELARVMRVVKGDHVLILSEGQFSDLSKRGFKLRILDRNRKWVLARGI